MKKIAIICLLLMVCGFVFAHDLEPLALVQKVFTDKEFAQKTEEYSTGEYKGHPNASDVSEKAQFKWKILAQSEKNAVINMTIFDSSGKGLDTYCYLTKGNVWKITAFRALAMNGFMEQMVAGMEEMPDAEIDDFIRHSDTLNTKEDFYLFLESMKLTLALDDTIIEHFKAHEKEFESLKDEVLKIVSNIKEQENRTINLNEKITKKYKKLLISMISTSMYCENGFECIIGGMVDNTVGYLYIPNNEAVPEMNPNRLIMLCEIGNGWYLFKTT